MICEGSDEKWISPGQVLYRVFSFLFFWRAKLDEEDIFDSDFGDSEDELDGDAGAEEVEEDQEESAAKKRRSKVISSIMQSKVRIIMLLFLWRPSFLSQTSFAGPRRERLYFSSSL